MQAPWAKNARSPSIAIIASRPMAALAPPRSLWRLRSAEVDAIAWLKERKLTKGEALRDSVGGDQLQHLSRHPVLDLDYLGDVGAYTDAELRADRLRQVRRDPGHGRAGARSQPAKNSRSLMALARKKGIAELTEISRRR